MKTLFLIRSGEAKERDNPGSASRPLSKRGAKAARSCALAAASLGFSPERICCDSRLSTWETASAYAHASGIPPGAIAQDQRLELKETQERLIDYLLSLDDGLDSLAILVRRSRAAPFLEGLFPSYALKLPKAGMARIVFDAPRWSAVKPAAARLDAYLVPSGGDEYHRVAKLLMRSTRKAALASFSAAMRRSRLEDADLIIEKANKALAKVVASAFMDKDFLIVDDPSLFELVFEKPSA